MSLYSVHSPLMQVPVLDPTNKDAIFTLHSRLTAKSAKAKVSLLLPNG